MVLAAALVALVVAGCGGGGGETTETSTTEEPRKLTRAALVERGDEICAEVNAAVGALTTGEVTPAVSEKTSNLYMGMVERLEELGPPEGDEGAYAKVSGAAEDLAKAEGEVKLAAEREDSATLSEASITASSALEEFQTQAGAFGFEQCSQGPGAVTPRSTETEGETGGTEEGGVEPEPAPEEAAPEEPGPEEATPETGGGGAGVAPETGGGEESGNSSGGVGPG